jgi:hypothetical protein
MHELPVTESILDIAVKHARQANAQRIADIYLVIGQLSSIVDDSIQFYWDIIAKDTLAIFGVSRPSWLAWIAGPNSASTARITSAQAARACA